MHFADADPFNVPLSTLYNSYMTNANATMMKLLHSFQQDAYNLCYVLMQRQDQGLVQPTIAMEWGVSPCNSGFEEMDSFCAVNNEKYPDENWPTMSQLSYSSLQSEHLRHNIATTADNVDKDDAVIKEMGLAKIRERALMLLRKTFDDATIALRSAPGGCDITSWCWAISTI